MSSVEFECPFCSKWCKADSEDGSVIHAMPTCPEYDAAEDSMAFVRAVNDRTHLTVKEKAKLSKIRRDD